MFGGSLETRSCSIFDEKIKIGSTDFMNVYTNCKWWEIKLHFLKKMLLWDKGLTQIKYQLLILILFWILAPSWYAIKTSIIFRVDGTGGAKGAQAPIFFGLIL